MKRILVAYDGSEPARRALETTIELAKLSGALVTVASVVPVHPGRVPIDPWDDSAVHTQELQEAKQILGEHGIQAEFVRPSWRSGEEDRGACRDVAALTRSSSVRADLARSRGSCRAVCPSTSPHTPARPW